MILMVPDDQAYYPTLGPAVCKFIEDWLVFGPGDLRGEPAVLDGEKRGLIHRIYEVYPQDHPNAGRRRFRRVAISLRKGSAKTELAAWLAACELHPDAPVRCVGWDNGEPVGGGVNDPYIPLVAYTEEQSEELCYGTLVCVLGEGPLVDDFDIGLERILRRDGAGKAVALAGAPGPRDGARTTFQVFDEPLALDTPLLTTAGWKTIGSVEVGDYVYGRTGSPARVLGASPVHVGRQCYRVRFVGGGEVVTDAAHRWTVLEWSNRPAGEVTRTTEEMAVRGVDTAYGKRWRLPRPNGYDGVTQTLLIDPYLLGLWLGDGDSASGYVTAALGDAKEVRALVGAVGGVTTASRDTRPGPVRFITAGLRKRLRACGLLRNKQIPDRYLLSNRAHRLALLQGLMDSDGHVTPAGHCTFVQCERDMASAVQLLVRSLGIVASLTESTDPRSRTGKMYKVHFTPELDVFRLERKRRRLRLSPPNHTLWPAIESIEPCDSVPVRCIAVESEDHLFLVGRDLHLTHNTHRMLLPKQKAAHRTMLANLPKRRLADPWSLEVTTAPSPGEGSIAESTMDYARSVQDGKHKDPRLFFFHRQASDEHDLKAAEGRRAAILEASGPVAEWSDLTGIEEQWQDPTADLAFLERVWLNRPVQGSARAFDAEEWRGLVRPDYRVAPGAVVALGFDGARFRDATALVGTEVETGHQFVLGLWERPENVEEWEVPVGEVESAVVQAFADFDVWRLYADPPRWESYVDGWAGRWGDRVVLWWTNRDKPMGYALQAFQGAIKAGELSHDGDERLARHVGNAVKRSLRTVDEDGRPLWCIQKERPDSPHKIDAAMAAVLSWEARRDAVAAGVLHKPTPDYDIIFLG